MESQLYIVEEIPGVSGPTQGSTVMAQTVMYYANTKLRINTMKLATPSKYAILYI